MNIKVNKNPTFIIELSLEEYEAVRRYIGITSEYDRISTFNLTSEQSSILSDLFHDMTEVIKNE